MTLEERINSDATENKTGVYDHAGQKIVFIDLKGVQPEGIIPRVEGAKKIILTSAPASVLLLTDFRNMGYDQARTHYAKQVATDIKPYVKKSALLGIDGLKSIILRSVIVFPEELIVKHSPR